MKILVINAGSSSLKYQVFNMDTNKTLAKGNFERIGQHGSFYTHKVNGEKYEVEKYFSNHEEAAQELIKVLLDEKIGVLKSLDELGGIGHRLLHGGYKITDSVVKDDHLIDVLEEFSDLGPLHNPPQIKGIKVMQKAMPGIPNVGVFDTAFHQTIPEERYIYPIPYEYYEKYKIRKYGFHGTSHKYVSQRICEILGKDPKDLKIINCHIGQGASLCAIQDGKSVETTMGLTPLGGLCMGARSGDLDPSVVTYIMGKENISPEDMNKMLNKQSGLFGISGISPDNRDIEKALAEGNSRAKLAMDHYHYVIASYIAKCAVAMGGVDVITFTAGVGERGRETRLEICKKLEFMGVKIDEDANQNAFATEAKISADTSKVLVYVVPTDEELMIAKETYRLVK